MFVQELATGVDDASAVVDTIAERSRWLDVGSRSAAGARRQFAPEGCATVRWSAISPTPHTTSRAQPWEIQVRATRTRGCRAMSWVSDSYGWSTKRGIRPRSADSGARDWPHQGPYRVRAVAARVPTPTHTPNWAADIEWTVQLLQLQHAHQVPAPAQHLDADKPWMSRPPIWFPQPTWSYPSGLATATRARNARQGAASPLTSRRGPGRCLMSAAVAGWLAKRRRWGILDNYLRVTRRAKQCAKCSVGSPCYAWTPARRRNP